MAQTKRIHIGFGGGQVTAVRLTEEKLDELREKLASTAKLSSEAAGWYELESEDGAMALDLRQVVFVKVEGVHQTIGFSGT
jgi:hypothetical protein